MIRRHLNLALLTALALVADARADIASFWPRSNIDIRVCIENLDEYPGYDFYLKYAMGRGDPSGSARAHKIESGTLTQLEGTGTRISNAFLVAVPRGNGKPEPPSGGGRDWLFAAPAGGLQSFLAIDESNNNCDLTFRVKINDGVLRAELVNSKNHGLRMAMLIIGIVLSAIALFVGSIMIRERRFRVPPTPKQDNPVVASDSPP